MAPAWRASLLALALALGVSVFGAAPVAAQSKFSVPAPRALNAEALAASAALAQHDYATAAVFLGRLLDGEPGSLIENPSKEDAWIGALAWAQTQIQAAPEELTQHLAQARRGEALAAFERITASTSPRTQADLLAIIQRYPGTLPSAQASLLLGDIEYEAGNANAALEVWQRGHGSTSDAALKAALAARLGLPQPTAPPTASVPDSPILEGSWQSEIPRGAVARYVDYSSMHPVAVDGMLWINTGLRVLGASASTGRVFWDSGEPAGWETQSSWSRRELSRGIGINDITHAVASDGNVVVAAQQLPFTDGENDQIDGLTITVSLPERRLFAFDARDGTPLWNHAPPPLSNLTDSAKLPFAQRARIAAPPVIAGSLALVPSYELVGRINLHVTAYDLNTGETVWDRLIVSGQTRVNLFGEHEAEFNTAPITVHQGRVLVCSNLGITACLDLDSGEPIWSEPYTRYELPRTRGNYTPPASRRWHNRAPTVFKNKLMIAPGDSPMLLYGDLETGILAEISGDNLEVFASADLPRDRLSLDHIAALGEDVLWLGGDHLAAFALPTDRTPQTAFDLGLRFPPIPTPGEYDNHKAPAPRPLVAEMPGGKTLLVSTVYGVLEVVRETSAVRDLGPADDDLWSAGNILLHRGRILVLTESDLYGWVNWDAMIAEGEAQLAADQGQLGRDETASLRIELGRAYLQRAGRSGPSRDEERAALDMQAARDLLLGPGSDQLDLTASVSRLGLRHLRYQLLSHEAGLLNQRAQPKKAIETLHAAYELAGDENQRIAVLFQELKVLGVASAERAESGWKAEARNNVFETMRADLARDVVEEDMASDLEIDSDLETLLARFDPDMQQLAQVLGDDLLIRVPLGYLALLAQAKGLGRAQKPKLQLNQLHKALWEYGGLTVEPDAYGETTFDLVWLPFEGISAVIESAAGRAAYRSFEESAESRLDQAKEAKPLDAAAILRLVIERYPHSFAAGTAELELLGAELARIEAKPEAPGALAALARAAMPMAVRDGAGPAARTRALLAMARGAALIGNLDLARLFAARLIELEPNNAVAKALTGGSQVSPFANEAASERRFFKGPVAIADGLSAVRLGSFQPLFGIQLAPIESTGGGELLLAASNSGDLVAFDAGGAGTARWSFPSGSNAATPWNERIAPLPAEMPDTICVLASRSVVGVTPHNGYLKWSRSPVGLRPVSLIGGSGLAFVELIDASGNIHIEAIDGHGGAPIWSFDLPPSPAGSVEGIRMFLAGTRLVVVDRSSTQLTFVLDATSGKLLKQLKMGPGASPADRNSAWITNADTDAGQRLIVPRLLAGTAGRENVLDVFDLVGERTTPAYSVPLPERSDLAGIIHAPSATYLWLRSTARGQASTKDQIVAVDTKLGALRRVVDLKGNESPLGLNLGGVLTTDGDLLMLGRVDTQLSLRAIALPLGPLWTAQISPPTDPRWSLYDGPMPPALKSQSSVALIYALAGKHASLGQETHLLTLDAQSGAVQQDRVLVSRLGRAAGIELHGIAGELFLFGSGASSGRGRLEILTHKDPSGNEQR